MVAVRTLSMFDYVILFVHGKAVLVRKEARRRKEGQERPDQSYCIEQLLYVCEWWRKPVQHMVYSSLTLIGVNVAR